MPRDGRDKALLTAASLTALLFLLRLTPPVSASRCGVGRPIAAAFTPNAGGAQKAGGIRGDGRRKRGRFEAGGPPTVEETDGGRVASGEEFGVNRDGVKRAADAPPGNEVDVFGRPLVSNPSTSGGNSIAAGYLASLKFLEEEVIERQEYTRLSLLKRMQGTKKAADDVIDPVSLSEWRAPSLR